MLELSKNCYCFMFLKWMNCAWKKSLQCVCGVGWGEGVGCLGSREWILCINPTRPKLHSLRECIHYFLKHNALKIQKSIIYSGIFSYCNTSMQTLIWSFALCLKRNFLLKKNIKFSWAPHWLSRRYFISKKMGDDFVVVTLECGKIWI